MIKISLAALWISFTLLNVPNLLAQPNDFAPTTSADTTEMVDRVDVKPANDKVIAERIEGILEATEWFQKPKVRVKEGIAFLDGTTDSETHRDWAQKIASKTQDVVAVVNNLQIEEKSIWDFSPVLDGLKTLRTDALTNAPLVVAGFIVFLLTWFATGWAVKSSRGIFQRTFKSQLLGDVAARILAVPIFLIGLYFVLRISGLTRLAVTVLGGTGLLGLILGFAFRDIAENFLASILISLQRPFKRGDLIEVVQHRGYVQSVNTRSTLLMSLEGNYIQIPNAIIYKNTILNFTANAKSRFDFIVGIGYEDSISEAQSVVCSLLGKHPAVLNDPEPLVLVESLGSATVNLRVYFWIDISQYSQFKVRSALILRTKDAFEKAGISMPDEAREIVFPKGVPVVMNPDSYVQDKVNPTPKMVKSDKPITDGSLESESKEIEKQAREASQPEAGQDLL